MKVLFHGIFTIIKLAILSSIYATLALIVFRLIGLIKPNFWADRVSKKRKKFWFSSGAIISVFLIIFSTTHWGSHGLGDLAKIPLRHGKVINQINGNQVFININALYGDLWIEEFAKTPNYLVGKTGKSFADKPRDYFVWDLKTNDVQFFRTKGEFEQYSQNHNLPESKDLKEFWEHYKDFWHRWRFWTLL